MPRRIRSEVEAVGAVKVPTLPARGASDHEIALAEHDLLAAIAALRDGQDLAQFGADITSALTRLAVAAAAA